MNVIQHCTRCSPAVSETLEFVMWFFCSMQYVWHPGFTVNAIEGERYGSLMGAHGMMWIVLNRGQNSCFELVVIFRHRSNFSCQSYYIHL